MNTKLIAVIRAVEHRGQGIESDVARNVTVFYDPVSGEPLAEVDSWREERRVAERTADIHDRQTLRELMRNQREVINKQDSLIEDFRAKMALVKGYCILPGPKVTEKQLRGALACIATISQNAPTPEEIKAAKG